MGLKGMRMRRERRDREQERGRQKWGRGGIPGLVKVLEMVN